MEKTFGFKSSRRDPLLIRAQMKCSDVKFFLWSGRISGARFTRLSRSCDAGWRIFSITRPTFALPIVPVAIRILRQRCTETTSNTF